MVTRMIGYGIVVSSDATRRHAPAEAPRRRTGREFFAAHGIAPPGALFDALADTFYFAKDLDGRFVWGNRLLQRRHRLARADDAIGRRDVDFLRRDVAERIRADDLAVMAGETAIDDRLEVLGDGRGTFSWLRTTKRVLRDRRGAVVGIEGVSRDILGAHGLVSAEDGLRQVLAGLGLQDGEESAIARLARAAGMPAAAVERALARRLGE